MNVHHRHVTPEEDEGEDAVPGGSQHLQGRWSSGPFKWRKISAGEEVTHSDGDSELQEITLGLNTSNSDFSPSSSSPRKRRCVARATSCYKEYSSDDESEESWSPHDSDATYQEDPSELPESDSSQEETSGLRDASPARLVGKSSGERESKPGRKPRAAASAGKFTSFTRKNHCYVCGKAQWKIARHFAKHADEEPDIAEALALPKGSLERKKLLNKLRNKGNHKHNQEVLRNKSGALKLGMRASAAETKELEECMYCKRIFRRGELWRHVTKCAKDTAECGAMDRAMILDRGILEESTVEILSTMEQDEIAVVIQHDSYLIRLAQSLVKRCGNDPSRSDYVRKRLREMGRLLMELHKKSILSFEDAVQPSNFSKVVWCVKRVAEFGLMNRSYNKPGLAMALGKSLKKVCGLVVAGADGEETITRKARAFMELCEKEWGDLGPGTSTPSSGDRKVCSPSTIPFTRDVQAFYKYLERLSDSAAERLTTCEGPEAYNTLCRVTLARAAVLNRCTQEVSRMTLRSFQERADTTKVLSKHFIRINIGTGQGAAVLLSSQLVDVLTLLISKRAACNVHPDSPFLFAKPDSSAASHHRGEACIRSFSSLCRAKNPEHLRSARLHKHTARIFQILNLENDELDHLGTLLGHDIRAERDYYRSSAAAVELAKIARLLLAMEKGSLERFKGSSLEEVEIEDELEPDLEHDTNADGRELDLLLQQGDEADQHSRRLSPEQDALEHIKACRDKPFLQQKFIDPFKGRGLFTRESIEPSAFVVEYRGNIFPHEGDGRRCGYALNGYMFRFWWNGAEWRIDASEEDGTLGRLANDEQTSPNCKVKKIIYEKKPHLCLFALKEITPGEEITFDYGNSCFQWRSQKTCEEEDASETDLNTAASPLMDETVEAEISSYSESSGEENVCDEEADTEHSFSDFSDFDDPLVPQRDEGSSGSDESDLEAPPKRFKSTKGNFCYVCGKIQNKISRHLFTHKKEEAEIAEVLKLRRNSKERKKMLEKLRNRGNDMFNQRTLKTGHGPLKLNRKRDTLEDSAICIYCKKIFSQKGFCGHIQRCPMKVSDPPAGVKVQTLALVATRLTDPHRISSAVRKMLRTMKRDKISSAVLKDADLRQLAQCLYHMNEGRRNDTGILRELRILGGLLLTLQERSIPSFAEAMKPQNFSAVVEAVKERASSGKEARFVKKLVTPLANLLKKLAGIKYARALNDGAEKAALQEAEEYIKLCREAWPSGTPRLAKVPGQPTAAFTRDVQALFKFTEDTVASAAKTLAIYQSAPVYTALLRGVVVFLSILNKNLPKLSLESFQERAETGAEAGAETGAEAGAETGAEAGAETGAEAGAETGAEAPGHSQFEQILSRSTVKIEVAAHKGGKASLVLTPELLSAVKLLVEKRAACGVAEDNPYLFGKPDASSSSICSKPVCFNLFVVRCGAQARAGLRSEFFQKQVARIFQILVLGNDGLRQLGALLGREIRAEKEYYRTPEAAMDIARISELLSALKAGSLESCGGTSLEEVEVPDVLQPEEPESEAEDEDALNSLQEAGV